MPIETIFVRLLDEGTDVWRPVSVERIGDSCFRLVGPMPQDEQRQFEPDVFVAVAPRSFTDGEERVVAIAVPPPQPVNL